MNRLHGLEVVNSFKNYIDLGHNLDSPVVFLDVSSLVHHDHEGGIQRVQKSLLRIFSEEITFGFKVRSIYFSQSDKIFKYLQSKQVSSWDPGKMQISGNKVVMSKNDIYLDLDLNYSFAIENPNFFISLEKCGVSSYFMLYDILPLSMPKAFPLGISEMHEKWLEIVSRSGTLICISETVAGEVRQWGQEMGIPVNAVPIKLGFDFREKIQSSNRRPSDAMNAHFDFLVVSTIEPRKAHSQILDAFEILWEKGFDCRLIFVGRKGWKVEEIIKRIESHRFLGENLLWKNNLDDDQLSALYENSTALINASWGEGFGLPLVEAASFGLPLIIRDIPIFREIVGEKACYFSGDSPSQLAITMEKWMTEHKLGLIDLKSDLVNVTWSETCDQIVRIIQNQSEKKN
jgi:glycosyltransferase involved in cell wall biosynthesis